MEGGGIDLTYMNGIGSPLRYSGTGGAAALSSANRTEKTEAGSTSVPISAGLSTSAPVDEAKVSTAAEMMARAMSGSDVRTDKVASLQQAIAAGTYSVPSSDVADKVISSLLQ